MELTITLAQPDDLEQILRLQRKNHYSALLEKEKSENGFVTVIHEFSVLKKMQEEAPQVIARDGERIAGYALTMPLHFQNAVPVLKPMFSLFNSLKYKAAPLSDFKYYVMGQICIAEEYRGKGLFKKLYDKHKELFSGNNDFCITEVAVRNSRSMRAHEKIGFKVLHNYTDDATEWNILIWDWKE